MSYKPEQLMIKKDAENIATIVSESGEKIARIDLNHPAWRFGAKHVSDKQYMKSIELLGNTKKLEGISAHYFIGGIVVPSFESRETKDGTNIFYDVDCDEDNSIPFREVQRDCGDKTYIARYNSYEHMQGLTITDYVGYGVLDQKTDFVTIYDEHENLLAEQIEEQKIKVTPDAATKYTDLKGAAYAIVESYGEPARFPNGCISIHRIKPKSATIYDNSDKEMAKFKFYENGMIEECYQLNKQGKRKNYHHYNTSGKENTLWFLLRNKLSKNHFI